MAAALEPAGDGQAGRRSHDVDIGTLPFRVYGLEQRMQTSEKNDSRNRADIARQGESLSAQAVTLARHDEQLGGHREDIHDVKVDLTQLASAVETLAKEVAISTVNLAKEVAASSNRIAWTFAGFALTVAGSAIAIVLVAA